MVMPRSVPIPGPLKFLRSIVSWSVTKSYQSLPDRLAHQLARRPRVPLGRPKRKSGAGRGGGGGSCSPAWAAPASTSTRITGSHTRMGYTSANGETRGRRVGGLSPRQTLRHYVRPVNAGVLLEVDTGLTRGLTPGLTPGQTFVLGWSQRGYYYNARVAGTGDQVAISRFVEFTRAEWARLRASTPLPLTEPQLRPLVSLNERMSIDEVADVYLPLSRLLNLYVGATQSLHQATATFIGSEGPRVPFVMGIAGSVAVGKSTISRVLKALLSHWPSHPQVDLITTHGFLMP